MEQTSFLDDEVRMTPVLAHLVTAGGLDELENRYLDWVPEQIPSFAHGVYLHDRRTGQPRSSHVRGLSRFYVHRYERFGRHCDPVLHHALADHRACDDSMVMSPDDWQQAPIVRDLFRHHDMGHVMCAPVIRDGDVVGTINFARRVGEPAFDDTDRRRATVAATMFSAAVAATDLIGTLDAERAALWGALEACRQPVIVSDLDRAERHANGPARELLDALDHDWHLLDPLLDGAVHGRLALPAGNVTVTSAPLPERPSVVVSILGVEEPAAAMPLAVRRLLTRREADIAELVATGRRDQEIAGRLHISPNTVKHHLKAIYLKLGVHSRVELAGLLLR